MQANGFPSIFKRGWYNLCLMKNLFARMLLISGWWGSSPVVRGKQLFFMGFKKYP